MQFAALIDTLRRPSSGVGLHVVCRKIANGAKNPESSLSGIRNDYYPSIAGTVDRIATGTVSHYAGVP